LCVSLMLVLVGLALRRRKLGVGCIAAGALWLWTMSTPAMYSVLGMSLERDYPPTRVETLPAADAIVVLGGGVSGNTNTCPYAELSMAADRVAHAARLWKAGKAPVVIPSGERETMASLPLLRELGLPDSAILVENKARNTEENVKFVAELVKGRGEGLKGSRPRILLVTSAWHMRRSLLMFRKYAQGVEVIPAACDYEATLSSDRPLEAKDFAPTADALLRNSYMLKEIIGYWGYCLLRR